MNIKFTKKLTGPHQCPALFITAPASGQGKTTVTAALARLMVRQGKRVRVFKTGPDYLDPQILHQASGYPVEQLDIWMAGASWCANKLAEAAKVADLILIEGAMGMFDGNPSSADLAAQFNIPMVILLDVKGMAQTAAAVATGLARYRDDIHIVGMIANRCGSARHRELIEQALPADLPLLAALERSETVTLPERHLGLVQASEVTSELEACFEAGADWLANSGMAEFYEKIPQVDFDSNLIPQQNISQQKKLSYSAFSTSEIAIRASRKVLLRGVKVGVAKDAAFSFIYESNLDCLREMGAEISLFSPLKDKDLPSVDALWLPGGYPELHAKTLSENSRIMDQIRDFFNQHKPILAECGGLLYCLQQLTDLNEDCFKMLGLCPGQGSMKGKRGCQGMQVAQLPEGDVRAHAHHRSSTSDMPRPIAFGKRQRHSAPGEAIYRRKNLTATYLHLFFPSNPITIASLFSLEKSENLLLKARATQESVSLC